MKHLANVFFIGGKKKYLVDPWEERNVACYMLADKGFSSLVWNLENENRIRSSDGLFVVDSFHNTYKNYVFARYSGIPIVTDFSIHQNIRLKGLMKRTGGLAEAQIEATIVSQNLLEGTVKTSDGQVLFLDWTTMNDQLLEKLMTILMMDGGIAVDFIGCYKALNLFPSDKSLEKIIKKIF